MKNIFRTISALAAIAAFASCAEQIDNPAAAPGDSTAEAPSSVEFVPMTFSTSPDEDVESKTTYLRRHVYWEETDEISVFSVGAEGVNSKGTVSQIAPDNTWVEFTAPADPDAASYYAVYPYSETNACDAEGNLTVSIPSVQTAVESGVMSGANTSVAYSVESAEGNKLQFRNVAALICISFETDADAAATKSVTIKAKKNDTEFWGLTGAAKVSFDDNMLPVIEEGDVEYVTLTAPAGGFVKTEAYHIPVYAVGAVAGFEVTYLGQDDKEYVKTNSLASTLERNVLFNIGSIKDPYLPEVIEFELDFFNKNWPFNTAVVAASEQVKNGETYVYTYSHKVADVTITKDLEVLLRRGCDSQVNDSYESTDKGLYFVDAAGSQTGADYGAIKFPAINGRYLSRVEAYLDAASGETRRVYLTLRYSPGQTVYTSSAESSISPNYKGAYRVIYELPIINGENSAYAFSRDGKTKYDAGSTPGNISAKINTAYLMRMRQSGLIVEKVVLKFTKTEPVIPAAPTIE